MHGKHSPHRGLERRSTRYRVLLLHESRDKCISINPRVLLLCHSSARHLPLHTIFLSWDARPHSSYHGLSAEAGGRVLDMHIKGTGFGTL